eukprot:scaffold195392_cov18-Prasinocladus_malaysianus.AAC.4
MTSGSGLPGQEALRHESGVSCDVTGNSHVGWSPQSAAIGGQRPPGFSVSLSNRSLRVPLWRAVRSPVMLAQFPANWPLL